MKVDSQGNIYAAGPEGVWVFSSAGKHLGTIQPGETAANCGWGGRRQDALHHSQHRRLPDSGQCARNEAALSGLSISMQLSKTTDEYSGAHMMRRSYITAMLAVFAGAKGNLRPDEPRPKSDRSVLRSHGGAGPRTGDAE